MATQLHRFRPAIHHSSIGTYILPGPVDDVQVSRAGDSRSFNVPLSAGTRIHGVKPNGVKISVQGRCTQTYTATDAAVDEVMLGESDMMAEIATMEGNLAFESEEKFEFFLYYKNGGPYYKYSCCVVDNFTWSPDGYEFPWSLSVSSQSTALATTAPGS